MAPPVWASDNLHTRESTAWAKAKASSAPCTHLSGAVGHGFHRGFTCDSGPSRRPKGALWDRAEGPALYQPRAAPWVPGSPSAKGQRPVPSKYAGQRGGRIGLWNAGIVRAFSPHGFCLRTVLGLAPQAGMEMRHWRGRDILVTQPSGQDTCKVQSKLPHPKAAAPQ